MKHRAVIVGAGRIGAGFNWHDDAYTHAGAYRALADRVELVGFVEPDLERRVKANLKWGVLAYDNIHVALEALKPDILSICVQPHQQLETYTSFMWTGIKGVWQEKPFTLATDACFPPIQVNYMRRGDMRHRDLPPGGNLIAYGKDDIHTRCHFEDLARWKKATLDYRVFNGPCAYLYQMRYNVLEFFDNGGVDGGTCFKAMLGNLLDHIEGKAELWSPPI